MVDLEKIGQRIKEERKYILKISQEKMAEDLNMYQADISNMEKAKSGSGITDLLKLDLIAEYLNMPLETLLFGREDKNMLTYHGNRMKLKESKKKLTKMHRNVLEKLTGRNDLDSFSPMTHECGPYTIYSMVEKQIKMGGNSRIENGTFRNPEYVLPKLHTFVFLGGEIIGVMVSDITTVMEHVFQPALQNLQTMIPIHVLDVTDVWRTLNPYWALWYFSEEGESQERYQQLMAERMTKLRELGEDRPVLYIESVYVREDCRRHGIFRLYTDYLKMLFDGGIMWLNMEPTSGEELKEEYRFYPTYSVAELGQINMNGAIAERTGFTVDPDPWHRQGETMNAAGDVTVETVLIRKCSYYLPEDIRALLKNDGDLVAQGRALQRVVQTMEQKT